MSNYQLISLLEIKNMSNHEVQKHRFNIRHSYQTFASGKKKLKVLQRQRLPQVIVPKNPSCALKRPKTQLLYHIIYIAKLVESTQKFPNYNSCRTLKTKLDYLDLGWTKGWAMKLNSDFDSPFDGEGSLIPWVLCSD